MSRGTKLIAMVKTLHQLTLNGKVQWEETLAKDGFRCSIPNGSAIISRPQFSEACFMLFDNSDRLLETLSPEPEFHEAYLLRNLYEEARRQAFGVDNAVDAMLAGLNQIK